MINTTLKRTSVVAAATSLKENEAAKAGGTIMILIARMMIMTVNLSTRTMKIPTIRMTTMRPLTVKRWIVVDIPPTIPEVRCNGMAVEDTVKDGATQALALLRRRRHHGPVRARAAKGRRTIQIRYNPTKKKEDSDSS